MYENLRSQFVSRLADHFDVFQLNYIMDQLDAAAFDFDIIPKERGLIVYKDGVPEILDMFIACKKIEGLSDATLKNYWWVLSSFFQFCKAPIDKISSNDVRVFLAKYQSMRNLSSRSLDAYRSYLSAFYTWACDEGYIEKNIMNKIKPIKYAEKQREALTQLELEVLRNACETPRDRALVEFMYSTGCRVSELTNVKFEDIDFNNKTVSLFGKGSKYRTSYLNDKSIYYLKEYLKVRNGDSTYVFVSERAPYKPIKKDGVEKRFRELSAKANIGKDITPHVLRHTTATVGLQNGMPVTDIQKMLGHSRLDTTMIYAEVSHTDVQNNHRKYVI